MAAVTICSDSGAPKNKVREWQILYDFTYIWNLKKQAGMGYVGRMGAGHMYKMGEHSQKVQSSSYKKKISHGV